ncbi:Hypothetical predicted protein [Octopus vulgaris]|uniref:KICSTOR complex protein SZT2 n=1 Tax=Octopus vulgaris TaxID=6645 RepID=A0AA36FGD7_OCTVU|nr:Hypothetical predicted protein [Octopus vulgaris]
MDETDEARSFDGDQSAPEAKEIYLLMKKEYRISRNIRATWYFNHLNTTMTFVPPVSLSDLSSEELIVLSVIPEKSYVTFQPGKEHSFKLTTRTKVIFMSTQYRIAFALDLSPSVSSLDLCSGRVLWDDVYTSLKNCLTGLVQPFCSPGSDLALTPSLYVTVVAYTPLIACRNNFVLCQGVLVTRKNLKTILGELHRMLKEFENAVSKHFASLVTLQMNSHELSEVASLNDIPSVDTRSRRSKLDEQKVEELISKPEHGFVNVLRFGILALQLLPENASAGIAVVTDGMVGLPDASMFEALVAQLRNSTIACSFLHIGCSHHSNLSFGRVPHTELMKFIATATFGGYFAVSPSVKNSGNELNVYHKAFFLWSFQKGLTGFEVPDTGLNCRQDHTSGRPSWVGRLLTHPVTNQEINVAPMVRKKHKEVNLQTTISGVLSLRLREGYTIKEVNLIKGESQIEVRLLLPWREYARIEYIATASWPLSPNKRYTRVEIIIEGSYDFLHEMTCTDKRPSKSPFRTAHVKKYWQSLQNLMQTDQLLVHLHSFSSNAVNYTVPKTLKNGLPLLPAEYSLQQDPSLNELIKFWNPIASLDINIWQKWMHTHRIGIILRHDTPLKKYLHTPNSNGYFQSVHCYKAMTALNNMLKHWCTFVLMENHSNLTYMYIKFNNSDSDKPPSTFYILRVTSKPPCLVLRLAFLGGTAGHERHAVVAELREEILKLKLPRGPHKSSGLRLSLERRKQVQGIPLDLTNQKEDDLSSAKPSKMSTQLNRKQTTEVKCCVVLSKPVEKILIRYERVPHDLSVVDDPAREIPRHTSDAAEKASRSVAAMFNTMSRYLYHRRWIWSIQHGRVPLMPTPMVGRMLSTLAKIRTQEGFHFALTTIGIVNMVLEVEMKSDNSFIKRTPRLGYEGEDENDESHTSSTCVVQYILFPPNAKNTRGSISEDEMEECELAESDGELQIVTECWVEPQHGLSVNNPLERKHLNGLTYQEIASSFYSLDYETISCLTTFEHLIYVCQSKPGHSFENSSFNPSNRGVNCSGSERFQPNDPTEDPYLNLSNNHVCTIPFPYNLLVLLPRCQQAQLLFSAYTVNHSVYPDKEWKTPNNILFEIFLAKLKASHGREIKLSLKDCQEFTKSLTKRKTERTMSASSLFNETQHDESEPSCDKKTNLGGQEEVPKDAGNKDSMTGKDGCNNAAPTKWCCFIQDINHSHMFLIFVPASFDDLLTLKSSSFTETLHDNLEIVAVKEWDLDCQKLSDQLSDEVLSSKERLSNETLSTTELNPQNIKGQNLPQGMSHSPLQPTQIHSFPPQSPAQVDFPLSPLIEQPSLIQTSEQGKTSLSPSQITISSNKPNVSPSALHGGYSQPFQQQVPPLLSTLGHDIPSTEPLSDIPTSVHSTGDSSFNFPPDDINLEYDTSMFQKKENFVIPVYIYDCALSRITDSLVHKSTFTLPPDIYEDHQFIENIYLGCEPFSKVFNNLDIHDDSSEGGRHSTASLDRRSNDSTSDYPGEFKKQKEKIMEVFYSSYVTGIFRNLTDQHYVDKLDMDAAVNICEELLPIEINIVNFLHATCGHFRQAITKLKQNAEEDNSSFLNTGSPRKSAVRFADSSERNIDQPLFQLPPGRVPVPVAPTEEGFCCEYISELHQIIPTKFKETMSTWFLPVPNCPGYYFYCPIQSGFSDNVPFEQTSNLSEQNQTTNDSNGKGFTTTEDTDILLDSPGSFKMSEKFENSCKNVSSDSDSDVQSSSSSGMESFDSDDMMYPLFVCFTCTIKQNSDFHHRIVSTLPTCLAEITSHFTDKLTELDFENLKVTFDFYCLTLRVDLEQYNDRPPKADNRSVYSETEEESCMKGFQHHHLFNILPKSYHEAVMDCKHEIEWLLRDEIACALRYVFPITEDKLQNVTEHVQESVQLGKSSCYIEEVFPQFVFGSDQCLESFIEELKRVSIKNYRLKREGMFFYLVLTREMAAHYKALSSAVRSLDDDSQTPEKCTKKSISEESRSRHPSSQKNLSRDYPQEWRGSPTKLIDKREVADVSIHLTNEKGQKEVCCLSPERVALLNKVDTQSLLSDFDEGVLKRSSSFGGFDAEGSRRAQYRTVAGSDKSLSTIESASATSTSVAMTTSVAKHLTNSPAAQLASRARHFSAPTAAQRNAMGAYSQPSTMPATPSWISSRGSYTEEAGYEGDSSDSNNDDGAFFNDTGGQRSSMPNFWLILRVEAKKVTIYYHSRKYKDLCVTQNVKQLVTDVSEIVMDTCKRVNQLFLLHDLYTTHSCNVLLVPEADEDVCWTKDRYAGRTDPEDEEEDDEQQNYGYLADTRSFLPGHFACKCIWESHFQLHPRLKNCAPRSNVSTGMHALRSVLHKFSVNNRKNMFVIKDKLDNYFYVRLNEGKLSCSSDDLGNSRQDYDCSFSDYTTVSPILNSKRDDDEESSRSLRDVDSLSVSSLGSYAGKRAEECIVMCIHGITQAGAEMKENLIKMLQNKLDDKVLDIISVMLDRNPKCKLSFQDVRFIQRYKEKPKDTIYLTVPSSSSKHLFALSYYLKQNLLHFVNIPNYVDNHPSKHFIDYASSEHQELKENQVFLYHRPSSSGSKGIACIAMAFVDEHEQEIKFTGCQKPLQLVYDDMVPPEKYLSLIESALLEKLPAPRTGLNRYIRFRIWQRGNADVHNLRDKLHTSVQCALCDVISEFKLLNFPICQASHDLLPSFSEPCSPSVVKVRENEEKLQVASRKLTIQSKLSAKSLFKDKSKPPISTPSSKDTTKGSETSWNTSASSNESPSSQYSSFQHKVKDQPHMFFQYESGEKGFLHPVFWTSLPHWLDFCVNLAVPAVTKIELELQARFSIEFLLRELPNQFATVARDINIRIFKLVQDSPQDEILIGVPYSIIRSSASKRGSMDTTFDVDWNNKAPPGKQQTFLVIGRNVEEWSASVDHSGGSDGNDDNLFGHSHRATHREFRFHPYVPGSCNSSLDKGSEGSPTETKYNLFAPRQRLLLLQINDKKMTFFTYNIAADMTESFNKLLKNMVHWQNARAHVLDCLVTQKMGLYHHQSFGDSPALKQNPYTQSNMDVDLLLMKTHLPKDGLKRNNSSLSGTMPYPQITRPFDEIYRNLKPAHPLQNSPRKFDIVLQHGQQAQEIRTNYGRDIDKVFKLKELHAMWFSKNWAPISEDIVHLLKQSTRLLHYCATPLLFSPAWRKEVLRRVPSKKPELTSASFVQEKTETKAATVTKSRSRHSSGASIASLLSKRHETSQEGKKKDRFSQDSMESPQQKNSSIESTQEEEDWHKEIRKKFLSQYMQHLQSLGFFPIQTRPASPKRNNNRQPLKKLPSDQSRNSRDDAEKQKKEVYDMQKTLPGGMILMELSFSDQHYYVKLYGYDCSRMGTNVNSQLRLYFVDECDTYRALTHVHSFAHDFHLQCIMSHIAGAQDIFLKDYHLTNFLLDFLEVYPTPPNFSRNYVHRARIQLTNLTCPSGQLYDYILKHPNLHDFTVIQQQAAAHTDSELDLDLGLVQEKEYALVLHRHSRTSGGNNDNTGGQNNDEYNVGVVVKLDTLGGSGSSSTGSSTGAVGQNSSKDNTVLQLEFFLVLTSKCELLPTQSFVQKLGGALRATSASASPGVEEEFDQVYVPVKQHIGVRSETTNKTRGLSPFHRLVTREVDAAKRKIERTVMSCMAKCRRDILWERLLKGGQEEDGKKKKKSEGDEGLFRLTFSEFEELMCMVESSSLSELDERLLHFTNMGRNWFNTLLTYLPSRYGDQFRHFVNADGKIQCAVIVSPDYSDTCIQLTVNSAVVRADLSLLNREPRPVGPSQSQEDEQHQEAVQNLVESFIGACCFHLWSSML